MQPRYPWDTWFQQKHLVLTRPQDFTCLPYGLAQQLRNNAARYGVKVRVRIGENSVEVWVQGRYRPLRPVTGTSYPWDQWLQADVSLLAGKDFRCTPVSLAQQARNLASRRGLPLTVQVEGNQVHLMPGRN